MKKKKTKIKYSRIIKWIIILLLAGYFLTGYAKGINLGYDIRRQAPEDATMTLEAMSVPEMIEHISPQFGQSPSVIKTIVCSESDFLVLPHDGNKGTNVTGIWDSTFDGWLPQYEKENGETLNKHSTYDSLKMMSWAFSKGDEYRYQWSTYHAYINGGSAKIWSRYYKKYLYITIPNRCKY